MAYPTLANFRTFLDIGSDVGTDDGLQLILNSAINFVEDKTSRNFSTTIRTSTEKFRIDRLDYSDGRLIVRPRWFDIMAVNSVLDDDTAVAADKYYILHNRLYIEPVLAGEILTITYHYGVSETPAGISEAVLLKAKLLANESGNDALHTQKIISERTGDHQVSYEERQAGMNRQLNDILGRFAGYG